MKPGLYDISERDYHADKLALVPSLSSSIANIMLQQTPRHAMIAHPRLNHGIEKSDPTRAAEIGTAAHKMLTKKGAQIVIIDAANYQTKAAKEERAAAYADGNAPILAEDLKKANMIAAAVLARVCAIPEISDVFKDGIGEQVMLWQDTADVWCRAMIDWWQPSTLTAFDIKTTAAGLSDRDIRNKIIGGWDVQCGLYLRGLTKLFPDHAGRFRWIWIVVEQDEPHEVRIIQADHVTREIGDRKAATAISMWSQCMVTGEWPGYPARVETIEYPSFEIDKQMAREEASDLRAFEPLSSVPRPPRAINDVAFGANIVRL